MPGRKRGPDTPATAPQPQTAAATHQARNPQTNVTKYRITMNTCTVSMFSDCNISKNRRMRPDEYETELYLAKMFKRPPNQYIKDRPFYPYVPHDPANNKYHVNFDLNYN
uniref:Uncharacterized protein n=1 Tax=Anelloviridae sp. TaxID=2055263 RepID=A0A890CBB7_9VIRU|nr:hypothetical protein [Anelloviridae sp.]